LVTKDGAPESSVTVTWATNFGVISPRTGPTNEQGVSSATWTLGPELGTQVATASLAGATGSPLTFTATATPADAPPTDLRIRVLRTR
jgi:hypothetical protein